MCRVFGQHRDLHTYTPTHTAHTRRTLSTTPFHIISRWSKVWEEKQAVEDEERIEGWCLITLDVGCVTWSNEWLLLCCVPGQASMSDCRECLFSFSCFTLRNSLPHLEWHKQTSCGKMSVLQVGRLGRFWKWVPLVSVLFRVPWVRGHSSGR